MKIILSTLLNSWITEVSVLKLEEDEEEISVDAAVVSELYSFRIYFMS